MTCSYKQQFSMRRFLRKYGVLICVVIACISSLVLLASVYSLAQQGKEVPRVVEDPLVFEIDPIERLLYAMGRAENKDVAGLDSSIVGDDGLSIGPLQITRPYWEDTEMLGYWEDCYRWDYACEVVRRYWQRWVPEALAAHDFETLARVHNKGPRGHLKLSSIPYWVKVKKKLNDSK